MTDKWTAVAEAMEVRARKHYMRKAESDIAFGRSSDIAFGRSEGLREAAAMVRKAMGEGGSIPVTEALREAVELLALGFKTEVVDQGDWSLTFRYGGDTVTMRKASDALDAAIAALSTHPIEGKE